jgi:hypothetical protein
MIESAKEEGGRVGVIAPHGVLFRDGAEGRIRKALIEENLLDAVVGLPEKLFFGTGTLGSPKSSVQGSRFRVQGFGLRPITALFPLSLNRFGIRCAAVVPCSLISEPCRQSPQQWSADRSA